MLNGAKPPPQSIHLFCPKCQFAVDGTRVAFSTLKLDHKTWCKRCHRSHWVQDWTCQCQMPWHLCHTHRHEPQRLRQLQEGRAKKKHHNVPKRPLEEACTEAGAKRLDEAPKRQEAPAPDDQIDLGPNRPSTLLPNIRAKFRRILNKEEGNTPSIGQPAPEVSPSRETAGEGTRRLVGKGPTGADQQAADHEKGSRADGEEEAPSRASARHCTDYPSPQ